MYAPLPGIDVYHEDQGAGDPLVLLHGGALTLDLSFGALIPRLTRHRRIIAIELQGHGRTADPTDREITLARMADDVVGVLEHLGLGRADVLGFSWYGLSTFEAVVAQLDPIVTAEENWTPAQLAGVAAPTLVVIGDHDFVRVDHAATMAATIPDAALAVVPRTTHVHLFDRVEIVAPILEDFLSHRRAR